MRASTLKKKKGYNALNPLANIQELILCCEAEKLIRVIFYRDFHNTS